mmetsp:Transcript_1088/g.1665  ORF Transcript_1088/g.1665 Transcript_1088/m.1665 type:complete len:230 (-) Transcript_1088:497-1186(-)
MASSSSSLPLICVLDFEATCDENTVPQPQEIIEFPSVLCAFEETAVGKRTLRVLDEIQIYVKPEANPLLTPFCTQLTGIQQDWVSAGVPLRDALHLYHQWIGKHVSSLEEQDIENRVLFITCGDWDLRTCLPRQLQYLRTKSPRYLREWCNIKKCFRECYPRSRANGMVDMLNHLKLGLLGRHHSGLDDCRNIARMATRMVEDGWLPHKTSSFKGEIRCNSLKSDHLGK